MSEPLRHVAISASDTPAGRAEWFRQCAVKVNQVIQRLADYLPLTGGTLTGDLSVPDEAYGATWDGSTEVPTKNALYDKIETLGGGGGTTTNSLTITNTGGAAAGATFNGAAAVTIDYSTVGAAASSHNHDASYLQLSGGTLTGDLSVPDEAYGSGWNGSAEVPTKNAVYDKIETLAGGLTKISTQVLAASAATIDFSSIASTYEDLVLVVQGRGTNASAVVTVLIRMNGDTGANYNFSRWNRLGSSNNVAQTSGEVGEITGSSAPANRAHQLTIEINNYKRTAFHKMAVSTSGVSSSDVAGGQSPQQATTTWRSTSAINQVTLLLSAGSFDVGTVATLYGRG